ncbi:histidine kinase [Herbihabitans rhizosphaerae]|uniref:histidine kinase n=1 Tax=Herbihabitans rhizosphaerae TaxID=1872711 RepID=A0A4Q7L2M2_9PSEU|nr:histidine kinase [Herbihabitans rhizosphaerae]RZS43356.1 histidine kinase [Herbihabitans rhizosphaerae]
MRTVLGPLISPSTYRRWAYLIMGGALLVPFVLLAIFMVPLTLPAGSEATPVLSLVLLVLLFCVLVLVSFIPAVRLVEATAARELLGERVPAAGERGPLTWPARWRSAGWFATHLLLGGVVSVLTLTVPPVAVVLVPAPFTGRVSLLGSSWTVTKGWAGAWLPLLGVAVLAGLVALVLVASSLLIRIAPFLLGPTATERLAEVRRQAERLAQRNRLARELHDSVGHALSIVTIQASAASRVLDGDREFVRTALTAIEESARGALADLDHVLGVLRAESDEPRDTAPTRTLADLDDLLERTRAAGVPVESTVDGDIGAVPPAVSREAYRIAQECLTNAAKHAGRVPVTLRLTVDIGELRLDVVNPLSHKENTAGGGRGLGGMRERVTVLSGRFEAGETDGEWRVSVAIPLTMEWA